MNPPDDKDRDTRADITRLARDGPLVRPADPDATVPTGAAPDATVPVAPDPDRTVPSTPTTVLPPVSLGPPPKAPKAVEAVALPIGYRLHEYRVDNVLGQGGFGITYLASDVNLNAKVAIKEYLPEQFARRATDVTVTPRTEGDEETYEKGLESYLVEARTLATFRHPHIVRVARFFEANNTAYMVLEYERGESLKNWWRKHAETPEVEMLGLFGPLLDGLAVVHEAGFLHRDIKPDNIYVRDADGSLVLLDFGAARRATDEQTDASNVVTPGYGPIEQYVMAEQGPYTDLYAFAATLYWMVTGKKPPAAPDRMVFPDPMVPAVEAGRGRYSEAFLKAVDWALAPEAKDRPKDVAEFRTALFAGHPEGVDLQAALTAGSVEAEGAEGWGAVLRSPKLLKAKLGRGLAQLAKPGSWPLAVKMTLAMVLAALAPMVITALYNYRGSVERVSAGELRNLEQLAASVAGRISQLLTDSRNLGVYVANDDDFVAFLRKPTEAGKAQILAKLEGLVNANADIDVVTLLDAGGTALTSTNKTVPGGNFKFRRYFREAIEGRPTITGIIVGATAGASGAFFANPVKDEKGKVIGVVTLRIRASSVAAILEESRGTTARTAMLVDGDGILLHHSDPWLIYKSLVPLAPEALKAIVADQRFRRDAIETLNAPDLAAALIGAKRQGNASYVSPVDKSPAIAGYAPVAGHDWVVAMGESREVFEEPLRQLLRTVLYSVGIVGLVFLVLAVWFSRTIVRPVEELKDAAHALKSGDYDRATVRVMSADEIGQLARVFNVMIDVLRQRERELGKKKRARTGRSSEP
jgi:HAMP domain-containing protein